jgi:integrase
MKPIRGVYEENGYVKVRIWLGKKYNLDGTQTKPYRRSMGPWSNANIQRAKTHVDHLRDDFKKGIQPQPDPAPLGFPAASHIYFDKHWKNKRGRSAESIQNTEYLLMRLRRFWPGQAWHTFTPQIIEDYIVARKKEKAATGTINRELAVISSMFSMMNQWVNRREIGPFLLPMSVQGIPYNPVEYVERDSNVTAKRERTASDEELLRVKVYCDANDPDMLVMIVRALLTGLRKRDLEKVNGLADVRGILSKSREKKLFQFPVDFSKKISYTNYTRRWYALRKACDMLEGEKLFVWHDWRHTSGTMLSRLGFSDEDIQRFYGHATVQQTRDYINRGKERLQPHVDGIQGHVDKVFGQAPAYVPPDPATKRCLGCGELKPLKGYYHNANFKSGLDSRCKPCLDKRRDQYRKANPNFRAEEYARRQTRRFLGEGSHAPN